MHLKTRNVNTAFHELVDIINRGSSGSQIPVSRKPSRNGNVLMIDEPVTVTYTHPRERVLFNAARDANPFFHLYQSLHKLAGRNDVTPLVYYVKRMAEFSDNGKTLNGAYGYRWRKAFTSREGGGYNDTDQLDLLVAHLKADPTSRRAVLQMWNVEDDLLRIGQRSNQGTHWIVESSKDVCCNLSVMFSLREREVTSTGYYVGEGQYEPGETEARYGLDMTVTNRSNDLVWGMLGEDFATFSVLHEYVAARLGAEVGVYHHFSNNLHVYNWNWKPEEWLKYEVDPAEDVYRNEPYKNVPLVRDPEVFERELLVFADYHENGDHCRREVAWDEPFFDTVAGPALTAYHFHKLGDGRAALLECKDIKADDWRVACTQWLQRRQK